MAIFQFAMWFICFQPLIDGSEEKSQYVFSKRSELENARNS